MSDKLSIISIVVSAISLMLSVALAVIHEKEKRLKIQVDSAKIIPESLNPEVGKDLFFLDVVLTNKSSVMLSIKSCKIEYCGRIVAKSDLYELLVLGNPATQQVVRVATELPCQVAPYCSIRVVLQFRVRSTTQALFSVLQPRRDHGLPHENVVLHFDTSRGKFHVCHDVSLLSLQRWKKEIYSYNFMLH